MTLLAIEVNIDSFFDVNIFIFSVIAFMFSVVMTSIITFLVRPLTIKANTAKGKVSEKINTTYLRLIIYILAEFIAFVSDTFLIIFANGYDKPWCLSVVFVSILVYKIIFVVFKSFKDLGFNGKGFLTSIKIALNILDKNIEMISHELEKSEKNMKNPLIVLFILLSSLFSFGFLSYKTFSSNSHRANNKIEIIEPENNRIIASEFIKNPSNVSDTLIFKLRDEPLFIVTWNE